MSSHLEKYKSNVLVAKVPINQIWALWSLKASKNCALSFYCSICKPTSSSDGSKQVQGWSFRSFWLKDSVTFAKFERNNVFHWIAQEKSETQSVLEMLASSKMRQVWASWHAGPRTGYHWKELYAISESLGFLQLQCYPNVISQGQELCHMVHMFVLGLAEYENIIEINKSQLTPSPGYYDIPRTLKRPKCVLRTHGVELNQNSTWWSANEVLKHVLWATPTSQYLVVRSTVENIVVSARESIQYFMQGMRYENWMGPASILR